MRGRSITLTVAAALISAGTPAAQTPTTDHSGISTAAQTTETAGQAQSFEDRWPVPTATAPQTPTTDQSGISTAAQTTETAGQAQSFEDRWPAQAAAPYLPSAAHVPTATAPAPETTGQATVPKKMGAEMDSVGDLRPAPDPE
jgi:hypothetical protein